MIYTEEIIKQIGFKFRFNDETYRVITIPDSELKLMPSYYNETEYIWVENVYDEEDNDGFFDMISVFAGLNNLKGVPGAENTDCFQPVTKPLAVDDDLFDI